MLILSFIDQSDKCIFKLKSSQYMDWDVQTKTKKLKPYYKRTKVICHCCKEGREMIISSTKNQDGKRSYYLKRKPKTEEHHPNCPFSKEREVRNAIEKGDSIRPVLEALISDSMEYAINTKRKKGIEATTDDLLWFIKAKCQKLKQHPLEAYRLLADSYIVNPTFKEVERRKDEVNKAYKGKTMSPFIIGKVEKIESKKLNSILYVRTDKTKPLFKYSVSQKEYSMNQYEQLGDYELWVAGILTSNSEDKFITLKKIEFFVLTRNGEITSFSI